MKSRKTKYVFSGVILLLLISGTSYGAETPAVISQKDPIGVGVTMGAGYSGATSNRGKLWNWDMVDADFRVAYYVRPEIAIEAHLFDSNFSYSDENIGSGDVSVGLRHVGLGLKWSPFLKKLGKGRRRVNVYGTGGLAQFSKTEESAGSVGSITATEDVLGYYAGLGAEITLFNYRSLVYFDVRVKSATFKDRFDPSFSSSHKIDDLSGLLYSMSSGFSYVF